MLEDGISVPTFETKSLIFKRMGLDADDTSKVSIKEGTRRSRYGSSAGSASRSSVMPPCPSDYGHVDEDRGHDVRGIRG